MDSILESSGAHQFAEDSTTTADGVGGERLATAAGDAMETLGATLKAAKSLKAEAGAIDAVLESRA
jgi:hypothetical protein